MDRPARLRARLLDRAGRRSPAAPTDDTDQTAAAQLHALLARLPASQAAPLLVFDGGIDSAQLSLDLADLRVAVLVRLRSDRCCYADPPPRPPGARGRPRRHGAKFNCADPATWPAPTAALATVDDQDGTVTVTAWAGLHPKQHRHPGHGSRRPRPAAARTVLRVQVERVPAKTRPPKVPWRWWAGPGPLDLDLAWRAYVRRFDPEHTVRFCKQALGWTTHGRAIPSRPTAGRGWSWPATPSCAWPARSLPTSACPGSGRDHHCGGRPTERAEVSAPAVRTRVASRHADTRRALPGRPRGRCSGPARRYPAIKQPSTKPTKQAATTTNAA